MQKISYLGIIIYMNTISQTNKNKNDYTESIINFVRQFKVISALKKANCYKDKCISVKKASLSFSIWKYSSNSLLKAIQIYNF